MANDQVLFWRDKMSTLWMENLGLWSKHNTYGFGELDRYFAFCAAKDWLQDTGEAILTHRKIGFCHQPLQSYIEFWGIMQGLFVQQDAIKELSYAVTGRRLKNDYSTGHAWRELRDLRNLVVGHPTNKMLGEVKGRTVIGRQSMTYHRISIVMYSPAGETKARTINLGELIDNYDDEAGALMKNLFSSLQVIVAGL